MNNHRKILYIFTRTPLHVGAGASVGAIDQPIIRERHTGFPIIPASSLKGTFADAWNDATMQGRQFKRTVKNASGSWDVNEVAWLFGSDDANYAFAGALQFSEAKLLAFPVRSAKGSFAWITCPLILRRAARDGVLNIDLSNLPEPSDEQAMYKKGCPLDLGDKLVLEEYTFTRIGNNEASDVGDALKNLFAADPVWQEVANRLVILSDGMMSFFAQNACEVAQHVRINDETGTAATGALFNQENVPSETMFYAIVHAFDGRGNAFKSKTAEEALKAFENKLTGKAFQFGGDASTGLGWCSLQLA